MSNPRVTPAAVGPALIGVGVLHLAFTPIFQPAFGRLVIADLTRTAATSSAELYAQESGFWYVITGLGVLGLGGLTWWIERRGATLPVGFGAALLGLSLCGLLLGPVTGFWLFLVPAALVLFRWRRAGSAAPTGDQPRKREPVSRS